MPTAMKFRRMPRFEQREDGCVHLSADGKSIEVLNEGVKRHPELAVIFKNQTDALPGPPVDSLPLLWPAKHFSGKSSRINVSSITNYPINCQLTCHQHIWVIGIYKVSIKSGTVGIIQKMYSGDALLKFKIQISRRIYTCICKCKCTFTFVYMFKMFTTQIVIAAVWQRSIISLGFKNYNGSWLYGHPV